MAWYIRLHELNPGLARLVTLPKPNAPKAQHKTLPVRESLVPKENLLIGPRVRNKAKWCKWFKHFVFTYCPSFTLMAPVSYHQYRVLVGVHHV